MKSLPPRLQNLLRRLDDLGNEISLAEIARAIKESEIGLSDVESFIHGNPISYYRARVIQNDAYEVYVMTWMPGQASTPHDHTGSTCALKVLQGEAIEAEFSIAADGYADFEYETPLQLGQISGGQDAGIHTIRNPSATDQLVTLHIYAPPLKNVRRFAIRPTPLVRNQQLDKPTIVIIGGGFSGAMVAAQLLKEGTNLRVALVERRGAIAEGLAYSTPDLEHLLNVPAARMSAWPDRPEDFLNWAQRRDANVKGSDFLPRQWYSEYLRETLFQSAKNSQSELKVLLEEVRRVARHPQGGWMVHLGRSTPIRANYVVLAIGHRPPSDPLRKLWHGPRDRFIADPWQPHALSIIPADETVAILGSGLTAIDTILSLHHLPRTAPITLISRSGLQPQKHASQPVQAVDLKLFVQELIDSNPQLRAVTLSKAVHRRVKMHIASGGDWRAIIDGLRPQTARLWQCLNQKERQKFISRLRPFWEVHRHRMASKIADRLQQLEENKSVALINGTISSVNSNESAVDIAIRLRGSDEVVHQQFQWIINCTGPTPSNRADANPVIGSLLIQDWVHRDPLALGIETTADGHAVAANGVSVEDLFVVGTLRKPNLWESTAVPELRVQAAQISEQILKKFPHDHCI